MITELQLKQKLTEMLRKHEGNKLYVYLDTEKKPTIGIGRCLSTKGLSKKECDYLKLGTYDKNKVIEILKVRKITQPEADYLLSNDIEYFTNEIEKSLPYFKTLPDSVKLVLLDMSFNLGINGLLNFKNTIALIKNGNYKHASKEMLNSKWAKQVGYRAIDLSKMLYQS